MSFELLNHIKKLIPKFENEVDKVMHYFERQTFPKNHILIHEETQINQFYFVVSGIVHIYYTDELKNKNTIHFAIENWWITEYNSFLGNPKAQFNVATLEVTETMFINKEKFDMLLNEFPFMAIYFNMINMKAYGASLLKQKTYATISRKDFHTYFVTTYPELVKRIPHDVLASYIKITPEELFIFNTELRS